jgi:hypothetical protein
MEAICSSETSVSTEQTTQRHIPEDDTLYFKIIIIVSPEGKIPLARPRRRWEDNIKMCLRDIGWGGMDWIGTGGGPL